MGEEKKKSEDEFDIFVANHTYPEATSIFSVNTKSLNELKDNCIIVLDTNSLLVPYNTGKESIEQIKKTYRSLIDKKRLVVPGQVAREFAKNRATKIVELFQQLNRKANTPKLRRGKYPLLETLDDYQKALQIEEAIDENLTNYRKAIENVLEHIKQWTWNDPVSKIYGELFNENVVKDLAINADEIKAELKRRQIHGIPPGYKDASKEDNGIGDFLIWLTILDIGKTNSKSVIFVSGEEKADWRYKSEGQALYPRFELVDEFRRASNGESFHIMQFSSFLDLYGASEEVVEEIRQKEKQPTLFEHSFKNLIQQKYDSGEITRRGFVAEEAIYKWLLNKYQANSILQEQYIKGIGRIDFVVSNNDEIELAVEVILYRQGQHVSMIVKRINEKALSAYYSLKENLVKEFFICIVVENQDDLLEIINRFERSGKISPISYFYFYLNPSGDLEEFYPF